MNKKLVLLVGPPGSGKSTLALEMTQNYHCPENTARINQDSQGKDGHKEYFNTAMSAGASLIVIDRMNFNKEQRERYLKPAREAGYETKIIVLQTARHLCFTRMGSREDHPTIKDLKSASSAMNTFMKQYERPTKDEADELEFILCNTNSSDQRDLVQSKSSCIVVDLDGTLCNVDHRLHHVKRTEDKKPDWKSFFKEIPNDSVNEWCSEIIRMMGTGYETYKIVYASGRPVSYRKETEEWLKKHDLLIGPVFMRERNDFRADTLAKEAILDFCIEPSYNIKFILDDRDQVVRMWRKRGFTCLQVAEGDF